MGLVLHDGSNPVFQGYTGGRAWNDAGLLGNQPVRMSAYNTAQNITALIQGLPEKVMNGMVVGFASYLQSTDLNIYVVKGVHQAGSGFALTPHITLGWGGYLWHVDFLEDAKRGLVALNVTRGEKATDKDADGFRQQGRKKNKGKIKT